MEFEGLPKEILITILSYVPWRTAVLKCSLISTSFTFVQNDVGFWKVMNFAYFDEGNDLEKDFERFKTKRIEDPKKKKWNVWKIMFLERMSKIDFVKKHGDEGSFELKRINEKYIFEHVAEHKNWISMVVEIKNTKCERFEVEINDTKSDDNSGFLVGVFDEHCPRYGSWDHMMCKYSTFNDSLRKHEKVVYEIRSDENVVKIIPSSKDEKIISGDKVTRFQRPLYFGVYSYYLRNRVTIRRKLSI